MQTVIYKHYPKIVGEKQKCPQLVSILLNGNLEEILDLCEIHKTFRPINSYYYVVEQHYLLHDLPLDLKNVASEINPSKFFLNESIL